MAGHVLHQRLLAIVVACSLSAGNGRACVAAETAGYACGLQPVIIAVKARPKILPPQNERYLGQAARLAMQCT